MPHQSKRLLVSQTLLIVLLIVAFAGSAQPQVVSPSPTASPSPTPCPTPDTPVVDVVGEKPVARIEAIVLSKNRNRTTSATIKEAKIIRRFGWEEPAAVNAQLYEGDAVETANESYLSILFAIHLKDADQVILYPNAKITVGTAWNWWGPILNRVRGRWLFHRQCGCRGRPSLGSQTKCASGTSSSCPIAPRSCGKPV